MCSVPILGPPSSNQVRLGIRMTGQRPRYQQGYKGWNLSGWLTLGGLSFILFWLWKTTRYALELANCQSLLFPFLWNITFGKAPKCQCFSWFQKHSKTTFEKKTRRAEPLPFCAMFSLAACVTSATSCCDIAASSAKTTSCRPSAKLWAAILERTGGRTVEVEPKG